MNRDFFRSKCHNLVFNGKGAECKWCKTHYGMQGNSILGLHKKLRDVWEELEMGKEQD